jgi:ATP-dependent exoDNAse (exonuclease V) alpha subunit
VDARPWPHRRAQFPLRLAYVKLTFNKSQGKTLSRAVVDLRNPSRHGQLYVALSRAR